MESLGLSAPDLGLTGCIGGPARRPARRPQFMSRVLVFLFLHFVCGEYGHSLHIEHCNLTTQSTVAVLQDEVWHVEFIRFIA